MTSTDVNETVTTTTTTTTPSQTPAPAGPNIKRHVQLYQYGVTSGSVIQPLRRFWGKKGWKEVKAIIYDDSTMKVFDELKMRDPTVDLKLENVALFVAFGKAANKYSPPPINEEEANFVSPSNFFAVPENQERQKVHWFAAKDERSWKDLIGAIAETVDGKVNPPQLGKGPKFRYTHDEQEIKWKTYWTTCAQQPSNLESADENGADSKYVATPLVAVLDEQKKAASQEQEQEKPTTPPAPEEKKEQTKKEQKSISSKLKPIPLLRHHPARDYYKVENVPDEADVLYCQTGADGLVEDESTGEKIIVVRLDHGKRVKEIKEVKKAETEETSPTPPSRPPPPVPKEEEGEKVNVVEEKREPEPEVVLLVKEESRLISLEENNPERAVEQEEQQEPREENVEIFTSQHSTTVNVASVEHTISTTSTEYHVNVNGVSNVTAVH